MSENPNPAPAGGENQDQDLTACKLGDSYDKCLLGATVRGHFAYSIRRMVFFESASRGISKDKARELVKQEILAVMAQFGDDAPEFIDDDELVHGEDADPGPKILTPGMNGFISPPRRP